MPLTWPDEPGPVLWLAWRRGGDNQPELAAALRQGGAWFAAPAGGACNIAGRYRAVWQRLTAPHKQEHDLQPLPQP